MTPDQIELRRASAISTVFVCVGLDRRPSARLSLFAAWSGVPLHGCILLSSILVLYLRSAHDPVVDTQEMVDGRFAAALPWAGRPATSRLWLSRAGALFRRPSSARGSVFGPSSTTTHFKMGAYKYVAELYKKK